MKKRNKKNRKPVIVNGHKLLTRRDFVAHGLVAAGGALAVPTLLGTLGSKNAFAATCEALAAHEQVPFLVFDCVGGIGLSGNWLALDQDQQLLQNPLVYRRMAILDPANHTTEFGLPLIKGHGDPLVNGFSGFYNSLSNDEMISPAARANFRVGSLAAITTNDTGLNAQHPGLLMLQSTMAAGGGSLFAGAFSDARSRGGGYSISPEVKEKHAFFGAARRTDFVEGLSYGMLNATLKPQEKSIVARFLQRLSESQLASLGNLALRDQYQQILGCALEQNKTRTELNPQLDPMNDPDAVDIFKLNQADFPESRMDKTRRELVATIAYNTIMRHCAGGALAFGGCDYHVNVLPGDGRHGDLKDQEVGAALAMCVELAHRKGVPLYVAVISDGSVFCSDEAVVAGERRWVGDSEAHGMALSCFYRPSGPIRLIRKQVGHYRMFVPDTKPPVVGAAPMTIVGNSPSNVAHTLFANYLAVNHKNVANEINRFVKPGVFSSAYVRDVLIFDPEDKG